MKNVKLVLGNVYVVEGIFFNRNEVVAVSEDLAEKLSKLTFEDYDQSLNKSVSIAYFEIEDDKPQKKTKKEEAVKDVEVKPAEEA
jgi:23S rRNA pseudoU1915 N3-methylase RlmH